MKKVNVKNKMNVKIQPPFLDGKSSTVVAIQIEQLRLAAFYDIR